MTAWLLKSAGFDVTGVLMRNWDEAEETGGECSFEKDQRDARAAARAVGIPLAEVDFVKEYWHSVFEPFLRDFDEGGATPNHDLACNRHIKFDRFYAHALGLGADHVATGHYAQLRHEPCRQYPTVQVHRDHANQHDAQEHEAQCEIHKRHRYG